MIFPTVMSAPLSLYKIDQFVALPLFARCHFCVPGYTNNYVYKVHDIKIFEDMDYLSYLTCNTCYVSSCMARNRVSLMTSTSPYVKGLRVVIGKFYVLQKTLSKRGKQQQQQPST